MIDTKIYKKKLEAELKLLESEMSKIARRNPSNPNDWEPIEVKMDSDDFQEEADPTDVADNVENFEENRAVLMRLEPKYNDVKDALEKIKNGTYGICEIGGEDDEIPEERLMANPAAKNCIWHEQHPDDK